jgi:hypothetical protein
LSHLGLIGTTSRREQSSAVHCGILMVHAGWDGESQDDYVTFVWCVR